MGVFPLGKTAFSENLEEAVKQALSTHPTIKRAIIGKDIAEETIKEERSAYFPTVSASVAGGRLYADNATSRGLSVTRGAGYSWLWEGNAALNQTIFDWNERGNRVDSAKAQRMSAFHSYDDVRQNVAYQAVQAYIGLYRSQELYKEGEQNLAKMRDYHDRIKKLVAGGGADAAEESRAGELVLVAENILADLSGQLKGAEASYIQTVGKKPDVNLITPPMPFVINSDEELDALIKKIQDAHPQVKAMKENIESLEYTARAVSKDPLPDLGSELSYTKRDQRDLIGGESVDARAMLRLSWNLETGGAQFARTRRAKLQRDEAVAELEELRRTLERNLRVSLASLEVAREQRDIQKKRYGELTATSNTYKQQFDGAKKRLIDVMQADSQAFLAYNDYLNARFTMLDAAYGFLTSQGNLTEAIEILGVLHNAEETGHIMEEITPAAGQTVDTPVIQAAEKRSSEKLKSAAAQMEVASKMPESSESSVASDKYAAAVNVPAHTMPKSAMPKSAMAVSENANFTPFVQGEEQTEIKLSKASYRKSQMKPIVEKKQKTQEVHAAQVASSSVSEKIDIIMSDGTFDDDLAVWTQGETLNKMSDDFPEMASVKVVAQPNSKIMVEGAAQEKVVQMPAMSEKSVDFVPFKTRIRAKEAPSE